ncbi:hypothetical protein RHMOL_Rhmol01G0380300 [Rhododendron molle]|uniref:Uncharacterized protein n=1 Tax=Rhododendron molle TaxID=49168 RepID=A0ACC0QBD0_RHOML|nr:hypothetical protein RHMOL_Rhmol01G0380300 [Rhododendron molle]
MNNKRPQPDHHRLQIIGEEAFEFLEKKLLEEKKKAIPPNRQNHAIVMLDRDVAKRFGGIQIVAFAPKNEG